MVPQRVFSLSAFKAFVRSFKAMHGNISSPDLYQVEHTSDERAHPMTQAAVYGTHRLLLRLEV